jgi:uncharacterized membrane protein HdeD (DUF308 family)
MLILARNWWVLALRGALAVLFGIVAIMWPGATIAAFVLLFGAFALVDGVLSLAGAVRPEPGQSRGVLIAFGLISLLAGVAVLALPGPSTLALIWVTAAWAVMVGVSAIAAAIALRKVIRGEWMLAAFGVLSLALGVFLVARPIEGAVGLMWAVGAYAIMAGATLLALGFRLRSWDRQARKALAGASPVASVPPRRRDPQRTQTSRRTGRGQGQRRIR